VIYHNLCQGQIYSYLNVKFVEVRHFILIMELYPVNHVKCFLNEMQKHKRSVRIKRILFFSLKLFSKEKNASLMANVK
jgi:hypothetical protein